MKMYCAPVLAALAIFAVAACEAREAANGAARLTERTPVAIDGIGPIKIGMTKSEAERVSGIQIAIPPNAAMECRYGFPQGAPPGLSFMLIGDIIARIDVSDNAGLATTAGAQIGTTEADIERLYASHVTVRPRKYQQGHDFIGTNSEHENFRYVFETDGTAVTAYRAGRVPEVEFVERCG